MKTLDRRTLLRGAGGAAIALPWLEAMSTRPARAATPIGFTASGFPKRLVLVHTGSGFVRDLWPPPGATATNFTTGPILESLAPFQQDLLLLTGIDNIVHRKTALGVDHPKGMGTLWTARELLSGTMKNGPNDVATFGWPNGRSVDQEIASSVSTGLPFKSLELGVRTYGGTGSLFGRNIFAGPNQPLPPEGSPYRVFDRLFKNLDANPMDAQRIREERQSVLDRVMPRYQALSARLGADDRAKIDFHLGSIRDLESRLSGKGAVKNATCAKPTLGTPIDLNANDNTPAIGKLQMDLLAMTLACDLTRVVSLEWNGATDGTRMTWLGISEDHHTISHSGDSDAVARDKLIKIDTWYAQQFAYLLGALKNVKEGAGTLLDNTVVLWTSEVAKGNNHAPMDKPHLLAGKAGGFFHPGHWVNYPGDVSHSNLLVTLINAMGVPATTFGNPDFCTGALTGLP